MYRSPIYIIILCSCLPYCSCPWRAVFHEKGIYSLDLSVPDTMTISSALESWIPQQQSAGEQWDRWKEEDAIMLMSVIERVSRIFLSDCALPYQLPLIQLVGKVKNSPRDVVIYQSWIRKIAKATGAFPDTFILKNVKKETEHAVSGGGFADIYMGKYEGKEVALKVLRVYITQENKKKVFRVCLIPLDMRWADAEKECRRSYTNHYSGSI